MKNITLDEVKKFTINEIWDLNREINEKTCLVHDFQIGGLDGMDFMEAYSKHFKVSLEGFIRRFRLGQIFWT